MGRRAALSPASSSLAATNNNNSDDNSSSSDDNNKKRKTAVIAGATGYIGRAVVRESVRQGYRTVALVRDLRRVHSGEGRASYGRYFAGAAVVECDVTDERALSGTFAGISDRCGGIDAVVSCLASRSGSRRDAYLIDHRATLNCLNAGRRVRAGHFVLLSAICVRKPTLQFQRAKLESEAALRRQTDLTYSIVRPTAFFKSVSNRLELVQAGSPYVLFGEGGTKCNPIAEAELAQYMMDCVRDETRWNRILNVGGPDQPVTQQQQGEMLFAAVGRQPRFVSAPLWLFDVIVNTFQFLANVTKSEWFENAAESARIVQYYAVEDMVTVRDEEKYGTVTLQEHYNRIAVEGQEYDPYTTIFGGGSQGLMNSKKNQQQQQRRRRAAPETV
jgi:divinyl chlorophyllide a 8-vinyl-reductase